MIGAEQGMTRMKRILMAGTCLLALCGPTLAESFGAPPPPPPAPAPRLLMHNGSVMQINDVGPGAIQISYVQARPNLGYVAPGTVLVSGQWAGPILNGTAMVWATCALGGRYSWTYPVSGGIAPDGNLVLQGPAPVIDPYRCAPITVNYGGHNGVLVFTPLVSG
jgi:hypothetical protein